jgi:hypothetical protein
LTTAWRRQVKAEQRLWESVLQIVTLCGQFEPPATRLEGNRTGPSSSRLVRRKLNPSRMNCRALALSRYRDLLFISAAVLVVQPKPMLRGSETLWGWTLPVT